MPKVLHGMRRVRTLPQHERVGTFRSKSDLRNHQAIVQPLNHQAIVQPQLYDCLMVTQITL